MAAKDPCWRNFAFVDERPQAPAEWSDLNEIVGEHAERLTTALGGSWEFEGPLYEADALTIDVRQRLRVDAERRTESWLAVSVGYPMAENEAERPPARLRFEVTVHQDERTTAPESRAARVGAYVLTGAILAGAAGVGYGVYRWTKSGTAALVLGLVAIVPLLVIGLFVQDRLQRLFGPPEPPPPARPELEAAAATIERTLRAAFRDVTTDN